MTKLESERASAGERGRWTARVSLGHLARSLPDCVADAWLHPRHAQLLLRPAPTPPRAAVVELSLPRLPHQLRSRTPGLHACGPLLRLSLHWQALRGNDLRSRKAAAAVGGRRATLSPGHRLLSSCSHAERTVHAVIVNLLAKDSCGEQQIGRAPACGVPGLHAALLLAPPASRAHASPLAYRTVRPVESACSASGRDLSFSSPSTSDALPADGADADARARGR